LRTSLEIYREVWLVDSEFVARPGERPWPVCLVAWELLSGRKIRLWYTEFKSTPPYPTGPDVLFVAYYASAELGVHLALGWPLPERILDLFTEFRNRTNGLSTIAGSGLVGALLHFGLDSIGATEKDEMRELILRGGPHTEQERADILDYCEGDVESLARLLPIMEPDLDLPRALYRGRYMAAAARMEFVGVPIDAELWGRLRLRWPDIQDQLIAAVDVRFGVYDGRTFKLDRFRQLLAQRQIAWPELESGQLDLEEDTFRGVAEIHRDLYPLYELRHALSKLRLNKLAVGMDGFSRCLLSAFRSRTSRNQPSNAKFIFGPAVWLRFLIQPPPGCGLAYLDWEQQEFGIAAYLSRDSNMIDAYLSGDPYLAFAKQAGGVPDDATKKSHKVERELYKRCVLGVQYAMGAKSLSEYIRRLQIIARHLLKMHREVYRRFWEWSDNAVDFAMFYGFEQTVFGWRNHRGLEPNPRSLRNFYMQANGAEMLRLACCLGTENGISICAPVHDAVMIMASIDRLDDDIVRMRLYMEQASEIVLNGFKLRTEVKPDDGPVIHPNHFSDERGVTMFETVKKLL
jgi:DNA polymerase I